MEISNRELIDTGIRWMWTLYNPRFFEKVEYPQHPPVLDEDDKKILRTVFIWNYENVNYYERRLLKSLPLKPSEIKRRSSLYTKTRNLYNRNLVHFLRECELFIRKHPRYKFK